MARRLLPGGPGRSGGSWSTRRAGLTSVEINGSFYSLQRPESYRKWAAETPDDFVFAVKGPRFVTHMKKLADVEAPLANFFASGVLALGAEARPAALAAAAQPRLRPGPAGALLRRCCPGPPPAAAELADRHDERLDGRSLLDHRRGPPAAARAGGPAPHLRDPGFVELLRPHDVALVVADTAGKWPKLDDVTLRLRLRAPARRARSSTSAATTPPALDAWAARIRSWRTGGTPTDGRTLAPPAPPQPRDVYVYFDNDVKVRAPFDAIALAERLGS